MVSRALRSVQINPIPWLENQILQGSWPENPCKEQGKHRMFISFPGFSACWVGCLASCSALSDTPFGSWPGEFQFHVGTRFFESCGPHSSHLDICPVCPQEAATNIPSHPSPSANPRSMTRSSARGQQGNFIQTAAVCRESESRERELRGV